MVSPVRIRVPPLEKVLQNAEFVRDGFLGVEVLPPQCHHNWLGEYPIEGVQSGLLHARHEVAVDVEGDPHRGMPEHLGDGVDIGALTKCDAREGVAEVMKPNVWQLCLLEQGLEGASVEVLAPDRGTYRTREHEASVLRILRPSAACRETSAARAKDGRSCAQQPSRCAPPGLRAVGRPAPAA